MHGIRKIIFALPAKRANVLYLARDTRLPALRATRKLFFLFHASISILDIYSKFERKILKNEGPDRFLVTPDLQHSRTEIIEFLCFFKGFLALTSVF